jgi:nucleotide-binding universal stress UspA family protein
MFGKILVPLDCSKFAETSLKVAIEIAKKFDSSVSLIHVVASRQEYCRSGITGKIRVKCNLDAVTEKDIPKICKTLLDTSKTAVLAEGVTVNTILTKGKVVEEILNTITTGKFDLVVMGSRGHGMVKKLLLGSVSTGVAKESMCPVLLTRN